MESITMSNKREISAVYYGLLQSGYDYYAIERDAKHNNSIRSFSCQNTFPSFFSEVKQNTCEVYPYWPRAAILEGASFFLRSNHMQFENFNAYYKQIMSAGNLSDIERDASLWEWISGFLVALNTILAQDEFRHYWEWENKWIMEQNSKHEKELEVLQKCLEVCVNEYRSPFYNIQIIINPIKCVYSADYHINGASLVFCLGAFRIDSVIHEFLHHFVHPYVAVHKDSIFREGGVYPGIDASYYLAKDEYGMLNAFEEYAVRELTKDVLAMNFPVDIDAFIKKLL